MTAAIRSEEAFLRRMFGGPIRSRIGAPGSRRAPRAFSLAQAMANREYRAVAGLARRRCCCWLEGNV